MSSFETDLNVMLIGFSLRLRGNALSAGLCAVTKLADCTAIGQSDLGHFLLLPFDLGDIELLSRGGGNEDQLYV